MLVNTKAPRPSVANHQKVRMSTVPGRGSGGMWVSRANSPKAGGGVHRRHGTHSSRKRSYREKRAPASVRIDSVLRRPLQGSPFMVWLFTGAHSRAELTGAGVDTFLSSSVSTLSQAACVELSTGLGASTFKPQAYPGAELQTYPYRFLESFIIFWLGYRNEAERAWISQWS